MRCVLCDREVTEKNVVKYHGKFLCMQCTFAITGFYHKEKRVDDEGCSSDCGMVPSVIFDGLERYVIGQEEAKKVLSTSAYIHQLRCSGMVTDMVKKANILLLGPTGSGKTYLVQNLAKILDVPFVSVSATSLTETGYEGESVDGIVQKLYRIAGNSIKRAESGIVFIDEIDKLCVRGTNPRTVGVTGVQQELLTLMEGRKVEVSMQMLSIGVKSENAENFVDSSKILFICGGAFPELDSIIRDRLHTKNGIGFCAEGIEKACWDEDVLKEVTTDDLRKFGMIPEFIGRLPVKCVLEPLGVEDLKRILFEAEESVLKQYAALFAANDVSLIVEEDAVEEIAKKAKEQGTGARALTGIVEELLRDFVFSVPGRKEIKKIIITSEYVRGEKPAMILKKKICAK